MHCGRPARFLDCNMWECHSKVDFRVWECHSKVDFPVCECHSKVDCCVSEVCSLDCHTVDSRLTGCCIMVITEVGPLLTTICYLTCTCMCQCCVQQRVLTLGFLRCQGGNGKIVSFVRCIT